MNKKGFTLVELAIVLVIIGLLVGGVLQGQELIKQAQIRNVLASLNQYDVAVNTFRSKYDNGLPGDFSQASNFGLTSPQTLNNAVGATKNGDGDGQLEQQAASPTAASSFDGEIANFFVVLSNAGLVKGSYSAVSGGIGVDAEVPSLPVGTGFIAVSYNGAVYYLLGIYNGFTATGIDAVAATDASSALGLTLLPEEAYAIDSKLDDGLPTTGIVQSISQYNGLSTAFTAGSSGASACIESSAYNVDYSTTSVCSIFVRASS